MNEAQLLEAMNWRYATKSFDAARKIPGSTWSTLEETLRLTPSSYGLQPWKFLVIQNDELRAKLRAASFNQRQVTECSHFVVFTHTPDMTEADVDKFLDTFSQARAVARPSLDGYRKIILSDVHGPRQAFVQEWTRHQCYIALGNFMTAAALLKIDTCPMEGLSPAKYDEILALTDTRYRTVVACAAGFRSSEDKSAQAAKVRYPMSDILEHH